MLAESGEDAITFSDGSDYAANVEMAEATTLLDTAPNASQTLEKIATPGAHSIEDVCQFFSVDSSQTAKTLIVLGTKSQTAGNEQFLQKIISERYSVCWE